MKRGVSNELNIDGLNTLAKSEVGTSGTRPDEFGFLHVLAMLNTNMNRELLPGVFGSLWILPAGRMDCAPATQPHVFEHQHGEWYNGGY